MKKHVSNNVTNIILHFRSNIKYFFPYVYRYTSGCYFLHPTKLLDDVIINIYVMLIAHNLYIHGKMDSCTISHLKLSNIVVLIRRTM